MPMKRCSQISMLALYLYILFPQLADQLLGPEQHREMAIKVIDCEQIVGRDARE